MKSAFEYSSIVLALYKFIIIIIIINNVSSYARALKVWPTKGEIAF